jgi:hypothetical protein
MDIDIDIDFIPGLMEAFNEPQLGVAFIIDQKKWCLIVVMVLHPER